jgi:hypothetical protein
MNQFKLCMMGMTISVSDRQYVTDISPRIVPLVLQMDRYATYFQYSVIAGIKMLVPT